MEHNITTDGQIELIRAQKYIVHYFDKNGALRSGRLIRKFEKGTQKGMCEVADYKGHKLVPDRVRNIESIAE